MTRWVRFERNGQTGFGTPEGEILLVCDGDLFGQPKPIGESLRLSEAKILMPAQPGKMVVLVDNYHALVAKLNHAVPPEPLYFLKGNNSFLAQGETIRTPPSHPGKVVYEGEPGIVIGRRCSTTTRWS